MSSWAAFWLFLAVYVGCECYLYNRGHDTLFWKHRTPAELAIQKAKIKKQCDPKGGA